MNPLAQHHGLIRIIEYLNSGQKEVGKKFRGEEIIDRYIKDAVREAKFWIRYKQSKRLEQEEVEQRTQPRDAYKLWQRIKKENKGIVKRHKDYFEELYDEHRGDREIRQIINNILEMYQYYENT